MVLPTPPLNDATVMIISVLLEHLSFFGLIRHETDKKQFKVNSLPILLSNLNLVKAWAANSLDKSGFYLRKILDL